MISKIFLSQSCIENHIADSKRPLIEKYQSTTRTLKMQQGRTVIMDEYANHNYGGFVGDLKIPNWIILMSDEHFKFIKNEPNFENYIAFQQYLVLKQELNRNKSCGLVFNKL